VQYLPLPPHCNINLNPHLRRDANPLLFVRHRAIRVERYTVYGDRKNGMGTRDTGARIGKCKAVGAQLEI